MVEVVVYLVQKQKKENPRLVENVAGPSVNVHCHPCPVGGESDEEATVVHDMDDTTPVFDPLIRLTEPDPNQE